MIYTKTGDQGETSLVGGTRVSKCDERVEAYGTIDELNAHIGVVAELARPIDPQVYNDLKEVQNRLFVIQTLLATEDESLFVKLPQLPVDATEQLERKIDSVTERLPKTTSFVIPGGNMAGAACHVARTVCRRAERVVVRLNQHSPVPEDISRYINRLSDYLFVLSRLMVVADKKEENFWSAE